MTRTFLILLLGAASAFAQEKPWAERIQEQTVAANEAHERDKEALAAVSEPAARVEAALKRLDTEAQRLEERLDSRNAVSERAGDLLAASLRRFRTTRQRLQQLTLPRAYRDLSTVQATRIEVQDAIWELELALDEPDRTPKGLSRREYRKAIAPLTKALQARVTTLEQTEVALAALAAQYGRQRDALTKLIAVALSKSYWLRTDPVLGPEALKRAKSDVEELLAAVRNAQWDELRLLTLGTLLALAAAAVFLAFRLRRFQRRWSYRGGPIWQGTQRTAVAVVFAAVVPALLLAIRAIVRTSPAFAAPLATLLAWVAGLWFLRALLWRILRPDGIAAKEWKMPAACAAALLRATHLGTIAAVLFLAPSEALREQPLALSQFPRLLYTVYLLGMAGALLIVARPSGPVIAAWTGGRGFFYRSRGLWSVVVGLFLLTVLGMHAAGFRLGARMLMENATKTVAGAIVLTGIYKALSSVVNGLASKVRRRSLETDANRAVAREQSQTVTAQLTRLLTVGIMVATGLLLMQFWNVDTSAKALLEAIHLYAGSNTTLTLWDLLKAVFWLGAGHFLVANLSGLYAFLVLPLVGKSDASGRFVFIALARYAILVIAYSAALLSIHFSFASLGWIIAAMSVGLGFGLQEIVANFVSGLILLLERPIRIGDIITVGDTGGVVDEITIRATVVTNWDRQVIIVPNKRFITENVTNWTRNDTVMRRKVLVGVRYGSDIERVLKILQEVVEAHPLVVKEPPPRVLFNAFGDSSLDFEVWFFADVKDGLQTLTEMRASIDKRFREEGIEIPYPQRDLHLRSVDNEAFAALLEQRKNEKT